MKETDAVVTLVISFLAFAAFLFWAGMANAHMAQATPKTPLGWQYGWECCSNQDCAQVTSHHVTEGPDGVTVTLDKGDHPMILWPVSVTIPYGSKQLKYESKDGLYHVCHKRQFVKPDGSEYHGEVICVYLPPRGF